MYSVITLSCHSSSYGIMWYPKRQILHRPNRYFCAQCKLRILLELIDIGIPFLYSDNYGEHWRMHENRITLSWGMKEQRLSTSIANSAIIALTSFSAAPLPLIDHLLPLLSEFIVLRTVSISFDLKRSTSVYDSLPSLPCFTNCAKSGDRPVKIKFYGFQISVGVTVAELLHLLWPTRWIRMTERMLIEQITQSYLTSDSKRRGRY